MVTQLIYAQLIFRSLATLGRNSKILPNEMGEISELAADLISGGNLTMLELRSLSNEIADMAEANENPSIEQIRAMIDSRRSIQNVIDSVDLENPEPELRRAAIARAERIRERLAAVDSTEDPNHEAETGV